MFAIYFLLLKIFSLKIFVIPPGTFFCREYAKFLDFNYQIFTNKDVPEDHHYTTDYVHTVFLIDKGEIVGSTFVHKTAFHFDILSKNFKKSERMISGISVQTIKSIDRSKKSYKYFYGERKNIIDYIFIFQLGIKKEFRKCGYSKILIKKVVKHFNPSLISICVNPIDEYAAINFHNYYNMNFHRLWFSNNNADIIMNKTVDSFMNNMLRKNDLIEYLDRMKKKFIYICLYAFRDEFEKSFSEKKENHIEFGKKLCKKMLEFKN